jgi:hypothetical protein
VKWGDLIRASLPQREAQGVQQIACNGSSLSRAFSFTIPGTKIGMLREI